MVSIMNWGRYSIFPVFGQKQGNLVVLAIGREDGKGFILMIMTCEFHTTLYMVSITKVNRLTML